MAFHVLVYAHIRLTVLVIENACTELVDKQKEPAALIFSKAAGSK